MAIDITYKVKAKYLGDTIEFEVTKKSLAVALQQARLTAREIFKDASGMQALLADVNVSVREVKR